MNRFKINKIGLLNFWFYDEEEFYFNNGKLLLKGSNGSGKSVTMQSFIPLLFDGNKSSERLDSFGTKARKIDDYLLLEGSNKEENTGYLYMELYDGKEYITIGMGLKAVKNKPIAFWGFSLKNKRINKDFLLYKSRSNKIPLSKKELLIQLQECGTLVETTGEYKKMVNNLIFGFPNMDMYDEFINLIIQIRSPKLSNSFKPSHLTNILSDVLQPLSENELLPMTEAIREMSKSKEQIEELKNETNSLKQLLPSYNLYNQKVLFNKAEKYNESSTSINTKKKQIKENNETLNEYTEELEDLKKLNEKLEIEEKELKFKKSNFNNKELENITVEINTNSKIIEEESKILERKKETLNKKNELLIDTKNSLKEIEDKIYFNTKTINGIINDFIELETNQNITELKNLRLNLMKDNNNQVDLSLLELNSNNLLELLTTIENKVILIENQKKIIDGFNQKNDNILNEISEIKKNLSDLQDYLIEELNDYKNYILELNSRTKILKIDNYDKDNLKNYLNDYSENCSFDIKNYINKLVLKQTEELIKNTYEYKKEKSLLKNSIIEKEKELNNIKSGKIIDEFLNNEEAQIYCNNNKINYLPLYKAIKFKSNISKEIRGNVENALVSLGLINSLIINPNDYTNILKETNGKYLLKSNRYENNISKYFDITPANGISEKVILNVLEGISTNDKDILYISENGTFKMSIMNGKLDFKENILIGDDIRKAYILKETNKIEEEIEKINKEQNEYDKKIETCFNQIAELKEDEKNIKQIDLREVVKKINFEKFNLEQQKRLFDENILEIKKENNTLNVITEELLKIKGNINIDIDSLIETKDDLNNYLKRINEFKTENYRNSLALENKCVIQCNYSNIEEEISELRIDISQTDKRIIESTMKIKNLNELLDNSNLKEAKEELLKTEKRLDELEKEIKETFTKIVRLESDIVFIKNSLVIFENNLKEEEIIFEKSKNDFEKEINLKHVYDTNLTLNEIHKKTLKEINISKTDGDLFNELNIKLSKLEGSLSKYTPLAEYANEETQRGDLFFKYNGRKVSLNELFIIVTERLNECKELLSEEDRKLFQDILIHNVGASIRKKIYEQEKWIKNVKELMESLQTSSGLSFSITWQNMDGETEDEINTKQIVDILKKDPALVNGIDISLITKHFRSKIKRAEESMNDKFDSNLIFEVLDYRKWFKFKLFYKKTGMDKKELTDKHFNKFSGGEKAIAMYIPLFSSIYAKYKGARENSLRIIALDEAFAGVDDDNIKDAFRIIETLDLDYVLTSQSLWGDYETVKSLAISVLNRPNNSEVVSVINYKWEGNKRVLVTNKDYESQEVLQGR